jgi:hypothetical protein
MISIVIRQNIQVPNREGNSWPRGPDWGDPQCGGCIQRRQIQPICGRRGTFKPYKMYCKKAVFAGRSPGNSLQERLEKKCSKAHRRLEQRNLSILLLLWID